MTIEAALFWFLAGVIGVTSLGLVFSQNIVRCAIWLLGSLLAIALLYFLLSAEFVGATQLIIYVGGTMVLVVFAVMLTAKQAFLRLQPKPIELFTSCLVGAVILAVIIHSLPQTQTPTIAQPPASIGRLGMAFLGMSGNAPGSRSYLFPFEIVSVHLLVALIGAAYLARAKRSSVEQGAKP